MQEQQTHHGGKKGKSQSPRTPSEWLERWNGSLEVLGHKLYDLRDARDMYDTYIKIIFSNNQLKHNTFLVLVEEMYLNYMLVGIRRLDDCDARSNSLRHLITEILGHKEYLPRRATEPQHDDLCQLCNACAKARSIVDKHLAHTDRNAPQITLCYEEMNATVDGLLALWRKYCELVNGTAWFRPEPHGWEQIFNKPFRQQSALSE